MRSVANQGKPGNLTPADVCDREFLGLNAEEWELASRSPLVRFSVQLLCACLAVWLALVTAVLIAG